MARILHGAQQLVQHFSFVLKEKYERVQRKHIILAFKLFRFSVVKCKIKKKITVVLFNYTNSVRTFEFLDI